MEDDDYDSMYGPYAVPTVLSTAIATVLAICLAAVLLFGSVWMAYTYAVTIPTGVHMVERSPLHYFDMED